MSGEEIKWEHFSTSALQFVIGYLALLLIVFGIDFINLHREKIKKTSTSKINKMLKTVINDSNDEESKSAEVIRHLARKKLYRKVKDNFLRRMEITVQIFDSIFSITVLGFWIWRSYNRIFPAKLRLAEIIFNFYFTFSFIFSSIRTEKKLKYWLLTPQTIIDSFCITSTFQSVYQKVWLNFAFLRFVNITKQGALIHVAKYLNFAEVKIQIISIIERICFMVLGFACTILTFETLGEFPLFRGITYEWTVFNSIYFIFVTLSTVGYGDMSPSTVIGRMHIIVFIVVGIIVFTESSTLILDIFLRRRVGLGKHNPRYKFVLLCGNITIPAVQDFLSEFFCEDRLLLDKNAKNRRIIVLVDDKSLISNLKEGIRGMKYKKQVLFFYGSPLNERDLIRLHVSSNYCEAIFILTDNNHKNEDDVKQIFSAISLKRTNPNALVMLLMYSTQHKYKLEAVDENLDTILFQRSIDLTLIGFNILSKAFSTMVYHLVESQTDLSILAHDNDIIYEHNDWEHEYLLGTDNEMMYIQLYDKYCGTTQTFSQIAYDIYVKYNILILAIMIEDRLEYNPTYIPNGIVYAMILTANLHDALHIGLFADNNDIKNHHFNNYNLSRKSRLSIKKDKSYSYLLQHKQQQSNYNQQQDEHFQIANDHLLHNNQKINSKKVEKHDNFPTTLYEMNKDEYETLNNHLVIICDMEHIISIANLIKPLRHYEMLLQQQYNVSITAKKIIIIHNEPLSKKIITKMLEFMSMHVKNPSLLSLLQQNIYFLNGLALQSSTLELCKIYLASHIITIGHKFSTNRFDISFQAADLIFLLSAIRKNINAHNHKLQINNDNDDIKCYAPQIITSFNDKNMIKFIHTNPDDLKKSHLPRTSVFANGSIYNQSTIRLALISSFFSRGLRHFLSSIELYTKQNIILHQLPIFLFRLYGFHGTTYGQLFHYLAYTLDYIPISLIRNHKHYSNNQCCNSLRFQSIQAIAYQNESMYQSAPISYIYTLANKNAVICDLDLVNFFDSTDKNNVILQQILTVYHQYNINQSNMHEIYQQLWKKKSKKEKKEKDNNSSNKSKKEKNSNNNKKKKFHYNQVLMILN